LRILQHSSELKKLTAFLLNNEFHWGVRLINVIVDLLSFIGFAPIKYTFQRKAIQRRRCEAIGKRGVREPARVGATRAAIGA
jgi:hypothetical protein